MPSIKGFLIPNQIQPREHSTGSGTGGAWHISFEGSDHVTNVWFNGPRRSANLNWFENDWNDNYWFAFVRYSLHSLLFLCGRVSFSTFLIHPPSMRPMLLSGSEKMIYFRLSNTLSSQVSWRKNFSISNLPLAFKSIGSFCVRLIAPATNNNSMVSIKSVSIFAPSVYRDFLGM